MLTPCHNEVEMSRQVGATVSDGVLFVPASEIPTVYIVVVVTLKDLPDLHSPVEGHLMRMSSVVTG